jgi:lambda family phage portal protein
MAKLNWLDSVVGYFSPLAGLQRAQARNAMDVVRKYDASSAGRRTGGWITNSSSANSEVGPALGKVRDRVRDLVRNNGYASKAVSVIEGNVIGTGIVCGIDSPNAKAKVELAARWKAWADSVDCDADGLNNFYGLQALAMRACAEGGEALIVRLWRKKSDGYRLPVPIQLQVLEGDYIDTSKTQELGDGGFIIQGIEFDSLGRRVAYWLWNQHPGEVGLLSTKIGLKSNRVDARDVKHLFRADRTGQVRGISWGAPCVVKLADLDAYEDAQLLRQKIAACFAGFVRDLEMPMDATAAKNVAPSRIEAGGMHILPSGKTVEFPNVPTVANDGHTERVLRSIAAGWGVTYESLTGDLSNVNFSSGRMGWIEFQRNVSKWQWNLFIPRVCQPTFNWFLEAADLYGLNVVGATSTWTAPRREMIDPTKEIPALIAGIRGGVTTLPEVVREQGRDFDEHIAEIKKANEALDKAGIILDSDARKTMKAGAIQVPPTDAPTGGQG